MRRVRVYLNNDDDRRQAPAIRELFEATFASEGWQIVMDDDGVATSEVEEEWWESAHDG